MKAPDKIYLESTPDGILDFWFEEPGENNISYIRKDALLEWLNSEIEKEMEDHYDDFSFGIAYGNVLEHINEM